MPALAATAPDPRATAGTSTVNVTPLPSAIPGTSFAKRGPTIKPWLTRKLAETTALTDATGQRYYHTFKQLPDKKVWQQYYQVIARPMSFDQVSNKINKRLYPSVQHFIDDVNLIFTNAQQFNPPGSPIHHASLVMQAHFADVMKEVPPTFIPPRKYNTAKRRAEQEARARGESVADASDGGGGGSKRRRTSRGMSESEPPEDHGSDDDYEEARGSVPPALGSSNPFGLPSPVAMKVEDGMGTAGGSSMSPTGTPGLPPLPSLPNLGGSTFNFGATGGGGAGSSTAPSPLAQMNGISNGSIFHEQQNKPRMIAKAPLNGAAAAPSCEWLAFRRALRFDSDALLHRHFALHRQDLRRRQSRRPDFDSTILELDRTAALVRSPCYSFTIRHNSTFPQWSLGPASQVHRHSLDPPSNIGFTRAAA